jgi:hypothetical protein
VGHQDEGAGGRGDQFANPPPPPAAAWCSAGDAFPTHGDAAAKAAMLPDRFALAFARMLRHPVYAPPLAGTLVADHIPITPIDAVSAAVATRSVAGESFTTTGVLYQPEEGLWCIDDGQKSLVLDLSAAVAGPGMFCEGNVVVATGEYDPEARFAPRGASAGGGGGAAAAPPHPGASHPGGRAGVAGVGGVFGGKHDAGHDAGADVSMATEGGGAGGAAAVGKMMSLADGRLPGLLRVHEIAHPPMEARATTLSAMSVVDPMRVLASPAEVEACARVEGSPAAAGFTVLTVANVHMDRPAVVASLHRMLAGLSAVGAVPAMLVLMGDFASRPFGHGAKDRDAWVGHFDALAGVLATYPDFARGCHIVLVPGPNDPGSAHVLPRRPIPDYFAGALLRPGAFTRVTLASNPVRLRLFTQEVVCVRSNLTAALRRRALLPLNPPPPHMEHHQHVSAPGGGWGKGRAGLHGALATRAVLRLQRQLQPMHVHLHPIPIPSPRSRHPGVCALPRATPPPPPPPPPPPGADDPLGAVPGTPVPTVHLPPAHRLQPGPRAAPQPAARRAGRRRGCGPVDHRRGWRRRQRRVRVPRVQPGIIRRRRLVRLLRTRHPLRGRQRGAARGG